MSKIKTEQRCCRVIGTLGDDFLFCGNIAGKNGVPDNLLNIHPVCDDCFAEWLKEGMTNGNGAA